MRKRVVSSIKVGLYAVAAALVLDAGLVFGYALSSPNVQKADAIIVMGAAINTPALQNRTLEALKLYEQEMAPVMVLSGGRINEKYISEATNMQRILQKNTNKTLNVILDENASNTYENIKNARDKLPKAESVIVVSDKFHLARSVIMAKSLGFKKVYYSAPDSGYFKFKELSFYYIREMAAMVSYVPKFLFK
jgi:uncharacterized SAM-binding protein YcdF (DUF218 family)